MRGRSMQKYLQKYIRWILQTLQKMKLWFSAPVMLKNSLMYLKALIGDFIMF